MTTTSRTQGNDQRQPRTTIVKDIFSELTDPDTTALALTGIQGLGKAMLADLVSEYAATADKDRFQARILNREIKENEIFRDLVSELYSFIFPDKPEPDLDDVQDDLNATTGMEPLYVSPAAMLYNAFRTANPPVLIVLKRFDRFLDQQTREAKDPEVKEWLHRLNHDHECASRILLTSSIYLNVVLEQVPQQGRPRSLDTTIPGNNQDIWSRSTVQMDNLDLSNRPTVAFADNQSLINRPVRKQTPYRLKTYAGSLNITINEGVEILRQSGLGNESVEDLREAARRLGAEQEGENALIPPFQLLKPYLDTIGQDLKTVLSKPEYNDIWTEKRTEILFNPIQDKLNSNQKYLLQGLSVYREWIGRDAILNLRVHAVDGSDTQPARTLPSLISLFLVESAPGGQYRLSPLLKDSVYDTLKIQDELRRRLHMNAAYYYSSQKAQPRPRQGQQKLIKDDDSSIEQAWHRIQAGQSDVAFGLLQSEQSERIFTKLKEKRAYTLMSIFCGLLLDETKWQVSPQVKDMLFLRQNAGWAFMGLGRYLDAQNEFKKALQLLKSIPQTEENRAIEAEIRLNIALAYQKTAMYKEAEYELLQALNISEALNKQNLRNDVVRIYRLFGDTCLRKGNIEQLQANTQQTGGNLQEAEKHYQEAEKHYQEAVQHFEMALEFIKNHQMAGDDHTKAEIHCRYGKLYYNWFNRTKAAQSYDEARELYKSYNAKQRVKKGKEDAGRRGEIYALNQMGKLYKELGKLPDARQMHIDAYEQGKLIQDKKCMADSCHYAGDACLIDEKYPRTRIEDARKSFVEALDLYKEVDNESGRAKSLNNIGRALDKEWEHDIKQGNNQSKKLDEAIEYYDLAEGFAVDNGYERLRGRVLANRGLVYRRQGKNNEAMLEFENALEAHNNAHDYKARSFTLVHLGQLHKWKAEQLPQQPGNEQARKAAFDKALDYYKQALRIHQKQKNWRVGVVAMHDRVEIKRYLNPDFNPESQTDVAYLLCAQQHDISDCNSIFSDSINSSIERLKKSIGQANYDAIVAGMKDPCAIVDADLK